MACLTDTKRYQWHQSLPGNVRPHCNAKRAGPWLRHCRAESRPKRTSPPSFLNAFIVLIYVIVQELCESRGGRPGLSVLTSLLVSVDVKLY